MQDYLKLKGMGKPNTFHQAALRSSGVVIELCVDKDCFKYKTTDAGLVRDSMFGRGLSVASVRRNFNTCCHMIFHRVGTCHRGLPQVF